MQINTLELMEQLDAAVERIDELYRFTNYKSDGTLGDIKEFLISQGCTSEEMLNYDLDALANLLRE